MPETRTWMCAPQVRDLPRDLRIEMTCACCVARRVTSAGALMEARLGAQFIDLLEWEARCDDCGGRVRFDYDGKPEAKAPEVVTVPRTALPERFMAPVVKRGRRRAMSPPYGLPQLNLPLPLPPARDRQAVRR